VTLIIIVDVVLTFWAEVHFSTAKVFVCYACDPCQLEFNSENGSDDILAAIIHYKDTCLISTLETYHLNFIAVMTFAVMTQKVTVVS